ncbi:MAG: alginate export family protein [Myxococcota bacterium]
MIRRLGAETFPAERIDTRGAFTNAFAIFPQVDYRPHNDVLFRGGVLVAWTAAALNDPVQSLQARDGVTIDDDLINFVGGEPGTFYGTELDGRFQWRFMEHFALDLEAAFLIPGDALQDQNGAAVNSYLTQARTSFFF